MISKGLKNEKRIKVTDTNTAKYVGSGTLSVFSTPSMIILIEETAMESVMNYLSEGDSTVGTYLDIKHTSATPVGMEVTCISELVEVDRSKLRFKIMVSDEVNEIGSGYHERFIVHNDKFMDKVESKLS